MNFAQGLWNLFTKDCLLLNFGNPRMEYRINNEIPKMRIGIIIFFHFRAFRVFRSFFIIMRVELSRYSTFNQLRIRCGKRSMWMLLPCLFENGRHSYGALVGVEWGSASFSQLPQGCAVV